MQISHGMLVEKEEGASLARQLAGVLANLFLQDDGMGRKAIQTLIKAANLTDLRSYVRDTRLQPCQRPKC